jgi:hypothetical protein
VPARRLSVAVAVIVLALISSTPRARANGRFPQAQAILTVPGGDGSTVFLRATFGLLLSRDAGASWRWLCERALGYEGAWDPPIAVTRDGRLWVGLARGLVSTLDGCTVEPSDELAGEQITDLTVGPDLETVWALTGAPDKRGAVWRRARRPGVGGWEQRGLLPEGIHPMTLEVAPSMPSRVYVTAQPYGSVRGWLWTSRDGGQSFTVAKNELAHTGPLFIAAVDPRNASRVVLRHLHTTGSAVLVTVDGGRTFKETLSMDSAMFGFARSEDGATLYAGSGLAADGLFRSTDGGEHFARVSNHGVLCLHAGPSGRLYACENPFTLGAPAIAVSADEGRTVTSLAAFADVKGAVRCGADAGGALCAAAWPETFAQLLAPRAGSDGGPPLSAPPPSDAGALGAGAPPPARRSCGCALVGRSAPDRAALSAGAIPLALWARTRRRRRRSGPREDAG